MNLQKASEAGRQPRCRGCRSMLSLLLNGHCDVAFALVADERILSNIIRP